MRVDVHTHFWPNSFYDAARDGREWHGLRVERQTGGAPRLVVNGHSLPLDPRLRVDPEERARVRKDGDGVDVHALSLAAYYYGYDLDPRAGAAYCRDVNRDLADIQQADPERFLGLAMLPLQDTAAAMKELEHAVKDLGLRGLVIGGMVAGNNLDDESLAPVFQAAADEGLFVLCHPPSNTEVSQGYMSRHMLSLIVGIPLETTLAIMSLIFGGVLDRCPDLNICFCQAGGYACYAIGRAELVYNQMWDSPSLLQKPPKTYLKGIYYDSMALSKENLEFLSETVGADRIMMGTDYPFAMSPPEGMARFIEDCSFLTPQEKRLVLGENAARVLGLREAPSV